MTNLFFNMKLLKKFDFPTSFENNLNEDIMLKNAKETLTHFQEQKYSYKKRDRANTFQDNYNYGSRSKIHY